jgi:hypothetical protein
MRTVMGKPLNPLKEAQTARRLADGITDEALRKTLIDYAVEMEARWRYNLTGRRSAEG